MAARIDVKLEHHEHICVDAPLTEVAASPADVAKQIYATRQQDGKEAVI